MNSDILEKKACKVTLCPLRLVRAQLRVDAAADAGPATVKFILNEARQGGCLHVLAQYDTGRAPRCHIVQHVEIVTVTAPKPLRGNNALWHQGALQLAS